MNIKELYAKLDEEYRQSNPPDFITHYNYVNHFKTLTNGLEISLNRNAVNKIHESKVLAKKINLLKLTKRGIQHEYKAILEDSDYALVCVSWISVKAYYLIFNLLLILKYLMTGNDDFSTSHSGILEDFKGYLRRNEIKFNKEEFNQLHPLKDLLNWKAQSGSNIIRGNVNPEQRLNQLLKKLALYKLEEYQRNQKIKNFRKKQYRIKKEQYVAKTDLNLCEFFYWYRIKANYRDLEFLGKEIKSEYYRDFYCVYHDLTKYYYLALKNLINGLSVIRLGKEILN